MPANTLPTDQVVDVEAGFDAVVSKSTAIAGAYAAAVYSKNVEIEVHILPKITAQASSQVASIYTYVDLQISATGSPATSSGSLDYEWRKNGIVIPDQEFANYGVFFLSAENAGTYTCTVSNDVGTVTSQPIHLEFADDYQAYAASFGLNSVTTGAPDADNDQDGLPNLLEFLFGGNPTIPGSGPLPTLTKAPGSNNLVFSYQRKIAATGITEIIEHAVDLSSPWTPAVHGQNGVTIVTTAVPSDATTERVTVTIPSSGTSRFVRLKAGR